MARVKISEFGIINKSLSLAVVTFYVPDDSGANSGVKATLYAASTGSTQRENPQTLDTDGKLAQACYVESEIMATITGINDRTMRNIKKIVQNPLEFSLPVTSSDYNWQSASGLYGDLAAVQAAVADAEAVLADAGFIAVSTDLLGDDDIGTVADSISSVNTVAGDLSGDNDIGTVATDLAGSDTIGTVAGSIANVNSVGGSISNVNTVAGSISNINAVAGDATDIGTVAASIADVNTVAADIADVSTVATDLGGSDNIGTVAGSISGVNTVAGSISSVNTVSGSIANVNTAATNIANINTVAGLSTEIAQIILIQDDIADAANNIPLSNRTATTDPGVGDDSADGYSAGSLWVNTNTNTVFICTDASVGTASWYDVGGSGGITDVLQDTTPQLGGNLDVNGKSIVSASAGNILITPDTTGKIVLDGLSWPTADGSADQVLKTDGAGNIGFATPAAGANALINGFVAGDYYYGLAFGKWNTASGTALVADTLYARILTLPAGGSFDRISCYVRTASSGHNMRLGIYEMGSDGLPGALVADLGTVSVGTTGLKEITISQTLTGQSYFVAYVTDGVPNVAICGADSTFFSNLQGGGTDPTANPHSGYTIAHTYGALPDPYGTPTGTITGTNGMGLALRSA